MILPRSQGNHYLKIMPSTIPTSIQLKHEVIELCQDVCGFKQAYILVHSVYVPDDYMFHE
jgi:hypothetical protein